VVVDERGGPLVTAVHGLQIGGRHRRYRPLSGVQGAAHLDQEVLTGAEVPSLHHRAVAGLLKLPSDPLGPHLVGGSVADKEVDTAVLLAHATPKPAI
jgi:hypothetical protein